MYLTTVRSYSIYGYGQYVLLSLLLKINSKNEVAVIIHLTNEENVSDVIFA